MSDPRGIDATGTAEAQGTSAAGALTPPPGNPKFPELDALRGLAAASVVVFHALQFTAASPIALSKIVGHLDIGVTVFFVLSGFLLFRPILAGQMGLARVTPTRTFLKRRALRLIPAYWTALAVLSIFPGLTFRTPAGIGEILLLQAYIPAPNVARSGIPPGWSISVEASFYLLLALYGAFTLIRLKAHPDRTIVRIHVQAIAALTLLSLVTRTAGWAFSRNHPWTHYFMLDPIWSTFGWFALGMLLAAYDCSRDVPGGPRFRLPARRAPWYAAAIVGYAILAATDWQGPEGSVPGFALYGATAACLVVPSALRRSSDAPRRLPRVLTGLGLVSYGVYLYHYPLLDWLHRHVHLTGLADFAALAGAGLAAAIALGTASWFAVEERFLRLK